MGANNYMLVVSPMGNTVYIDRIEGKPDKREVTKGEMVSAIVAYARKQLKGGDNTLILLENGQPVAEIKLITNNR